MNEKSTYNFLDYLDRILSKKVCSIYNRTLHTACRNICPYVELCEFTQEFLDYLAGELY